MKNSAELVLDSKEVVETTKEELLILGFRALNKQGQDYILTAMDMAKDKYKKNIICFPTWSK